MSNFKTCSKCGQQVDLQTKFCPQCGSPEFIFADNPVNQQPCAQPQQAYTPDQQAYTPDQQAYTPDQQAYTPNQQAYTPDQQVYTPDQQVYTPEQQPYAPTQQGNYTSMPYPQQYDNGSNAQPPKKKRLQWWHILLMGIGVVIVVLLVVLIVVSVKGDKKDSAGDAKEDKSIVAQADEDKEDDKELSSDPAPEKPAETTTKREEPTKGAVAYTKGMVSGNVYTNEWADMQLVIPDGYSDYTAFLGLADEEDVEDEVEMDMALGLISDDFSVFFAMGMIEIPAGYDQESYLEECIMGDDAPGELSDPITIAGQTFLKFVDTGLESIDCNYVRILDGHAILITVSGESESANDALVSMFTPVE